MWVMDTPAGPRLMGQPEALVQFSKELLETADGVHLIVDEPMITLNLINAHLVYRIVRDDFTSDAYTARLEYAGLRDNETRT